MYLTKPYPEGRRINLTYSQAALGLLQKTNRKAIIST
jgi:hypothetical protein